MNAHYFTKKVKGSKVSYLIISEGPQPIGKEIQVSGKPEAKNICKDNNLKPWNF